MKTSYVYVIAAILIFASMAVAVLADDACCPATPQCQTSGKCSTPAYDRTPVSEYHPCNITGAGPGVVIQVDPWARCGAFCEAGQLAPGWPYGWNGDYWLRPDSNF